VGPPNQKSENSAGVRNTLAEFDFKPVSRLLRYASVHWHPRFFVGNAAGNGVCTRNFHFRLDGNHNISAGHAAQGYPVMRIYFRMPAGSFIACGLWEKTLFS